MRARILIASAIASIGVGSLTGVEAAGFANHSHFTADVGALTATWARYEREGVPSSSLQPLRDQLTRRTPSQGWWAPQWWHTTHPELIADLSHQTNSVYASAMANARALAQDAIDQWTIFSQQQASWIESAVLLSAQAWPKELGSADTPRRLTDLATTWQGLLTTQRAAVLAAQQAKLKEELAAAGGPQAVLDTARRLTATAHAANLEDFGVPDIAAQLQHELDQSLDPTQTAVQLVAALDKLQALVALNNQVNAQVRPLLYSADQAAAEQTPNSASFLAQYQTLATTFRNATTADTITAVAAQMTALQAQINAELQAHQCGHAVPGGKVITINLTLQEMVFYQDGCAVQATPVTSGRPQLPTPTGTFHIFYKKSPFQMISPWPLGSPFYYPPTWTQWVMEFEYGGYFIHDAYWEPPGDYGPGSQNNLNAASHGCVHTPTAVMQWAYTWTPIGTPVIITA